MSRLFCARALQLLDLIVRFYLRRRGAFVDFVLNSVTSGTFNKCMDLAQAARKRLLHVAGTKRGAILADMLFNIDVGSRCPEEVSKVRMFFTLPPPHTSTSLCR